MKIPSTSEAREQITKLLASTRYDKSKTAKDKHGMPKVAPEPDDPDDE